LLALLCPLTLPLTPNSPIQTKRRIDDTGKRIKTKHAFKSSGTGASQHSAQNDATRTLEIDTAHDRDHHSILQRKFAMEKEGEGEEEEDVLTGGGKKMYKGLNHYKEYVKSNEKNKSKAMR